MSADSNTWTDDEIVEIIASEVRGAVAEYEAANPGVRFNDGIPDDAKDAVFRQAELRIEGYGLDLSNLSRRGLLKMTRDRTARMWKATDAINELTALADQLRTSWVAFKDEYGDEGWSEMLQAQTLRWLRKYEDTERLTKQAGVDLAGEHPYLRHLYESGKKAAAAYARALTAAHEQAERRRRAFRIAHRQVVRELLEPLPAPETRCSSCRKKPAKLAGMCKRCARAAGMLPHGKIGEEL